MLNGPGRLVRPGTRFGLMSVRLQPPERCDCCLSDRITLRERKQGNEYECLDCGAKVRCHTGTNSPLGLMADSYTRSLRIKAHNAIDHFYKSGYITRTDLYKLINRKFERRGREFHISRLSTKELEQLIEYGKYELQDDVRVFSRRKRKRHKKLVKQSEIQKRRYNGRLNTR